VKDNGVVENIRDAPDPELVEHRGHDVFVSYSRADREAVVSLTAGLASRGKRAWVDLEDIPPSSEWMDEIRSAIDAADAYLVVVSPDVARSSVCAEELEHARSAGKRIVPVVVRHTDPATVPKSLASLNWIDATEPGRLESALDAIVTALDTDLVRVKAHTHLLVRATDWRRGAEDRSLLLRGKELTEAEETIAELESEPRPTQLQTRFVLASRKAGSRRQRGAIAIVSALLLVAASMGVVALVQRNAATKSERLALQRAAESRSRELASAALLQLQGDPEVSVLLAVQAEKAAPTIQAVNALRAALAASHVRLALGGHTGPVYDVELTDGGSVAVSGGGDGAVRIWDLRSGTLIRTIETGGSKVLDVQVSSDGASILSIDDENHIGLWDRTTGERLGSWRAAGAALSSTGDMLVTVTDTGRATAYSVPSGAVVSSSEWHGPFTIGRAYVAGRPIPDAIVRFDELGDRVMTTVGSAAWVWEPETGRIVSTRNEAGTINAGAISPDGGLVMTASVRSPNSSESDALIWNADSGAVVLPLSEEGVVALFAAFDPAGRLLAVAGEDGPVHLWDIHSQREVAVMHSPSAMADLRFSIDGEMLVAASYDRTARIWDVPSGRPVAALVGHTDGVESAAITPGGDRVVTASHDGTMRVWEVEPDVVRFPDLPGIPGVAIWDENYQSLSPDGKVVATADTDGTISVWEVATGNLEATIRPRDGAVVLVAFSPQGDRLVTSGADGSSALWSWPDPQIVRRFRSGVLQFARFSDGNRFLAVSEDGVQLRDTEAGTLLGKRSFSLGKGPTYGADLSNDGAEIAFGRGRAVGVMQVINDTPAEEVMLGEHAKTVTTVDLASDGRRLLSASFDGTVSLWDVKSHELIRTFTTGSGSPVITAFFAPGDERFVASADDNVATVWDVRTGKMVLTLTDHVGGVCCGSYSPDGRLIETEADAVRIWDAMTGALLATIPITAPAANVEFTPDSTSLVITDDAGRTIVYHCELCVSTQQLLTLAESRVTRELTPEERATYLGE
jgi:WD40 repeat protein